MQNVKNLIIAVIACTLTASLPLEARPVQQIEADIKAAQAEMRRCRADMNRVGAYVTQKVTNPNSEVLANDLRSYQGVYSVSVKCYFGLANKLERLKKELDAAVNGPSLDAGAGGSREANGAAQRRFLEQLAKMREEVAADQVRLRDLQNLLKGLEARLKRK